MGDQQALEAYAVPQSSLNAYRQGAPPRPFIRCCCCSRTRVRHQHGGPLQGALENLWIMINSSYLLTTVSPAGIWHISLPGLFEASLLLDIASGSDFPFFMLNIAVLSILI